MRISPSAGALAGLMGIRDLFRRRRLTGGAQPAKNRVWGFLFAWAGERSWKLFSMWKFRMRIACEISVRRIVSTLLSAAAAARAESGRVAAAGHQNWSWLNRSRCRISPAGGNPAVACVAGAGGGARLKSGNDDMDRDPAAASPWWTFGLRSRRVSSRWLIPRREFWSGVTVGRR